MKPTVTRLDDPRIWFLGGLIVVSAAVRLVPHPPNVTPAAALALLAGAMLGSRAAAVAVPFAALLLSDLAIGLFHRSDFALHRSQIFVYGAFALIALLGRSLQNHRRRPLRIAAASLAASALFFAVTNFGVWLLGDMYGRTPAELVRCYVQAIPFFGNTVVGDLAFSMLFFGGLAFFESLVEEREPSAVLGDEP
ncbi:MAG: hypothetical protein KF861_02450 [Planctomycetaceae bacterium]|nr:hypothetical protein [Planctomycetaceae bacterium]